MPHSRRLLLTACFLLCTIALAGTTDLHAKRAAPKPVPPVTHNGIQFSVDNRPDTMGVITATDIHTGKRIWARKLYSVPILPFLEQDVQWVFITKMELHTPSGSSSSEPTTLRVTNERGQTYEVDPATGQSRNIKV